MSFEVDYFELDSTQVSNNAVVLTGIPSISDNVAMDVIGGTAQALNGDFDVTDSTVHWDYTSSPLYNFMTIGDKIRIIYDKS